MSKSRAYEKNEGYLTVVLILIYLALEQIPWRRFFLADYVYESIFLGTRLVYCVAVFVVLRLYHCPFSTMKGRFPRLLLFLPFLLMSISNLVGGCFEGVTYGLLIEPGLLVIQGFSTFFLATLEEVLFRFLLFSYLCKKMKKIWALLLSSAIFGALHLLNLLGGASVGATFLQVGYSFANGLVCGLMWGYGGGMVLPIAYHFLFNFLQGDLFRALYDGGNVGAIMTTDIIFAAAGVVYGVLLFVLLLRKDETPAKSPQ